MKKDATLWRLETFDKKAFLAITAQIEKKHEQLEKKPHAGVRLHCRYKFTSEEREHLTRVFLHHHHGVHGKRHGHEGRKESMNENVLTKSG